MCCMCASSSCCYYLYFCNLPSHVPGRLCCWLWSIWCKVVEIYVATDSTLCDWHRFHVAPHVDVSSISILSSMPRRINHEWQYVLQQLIFRALVPPTLAMMLVPPNGTFYAFGLSILCLACPCAFSSHPGLVSWVGGVQGSGLLFGHRLVISC